MLQDEFGAQRGDILRNVLKEGLLLTLFGLGIGVVASLGLTRLIESQLYGVTASDPATFAAVSAVLAGVALLAAFILVFFAARLYERENLIFGE